MKDKILKKKNAVIMGVIAISIIGAAIYWFGVPQIRWGTKDTTFREEYGLVLTDYAGEPVRMSAFRNKVMVAYAWASWCPYCAAELENLGRLKEIFGDEVQIVAVNRGEPLAVAKSYTDTLKTAGVVLLLDPEDSYFKSIGGYAMPETVFINDRGEILFHQRGPMQFDEVTEKIRQLIGNR